MAERPLVVLAWPFGRPEDRNPYTRLIHSEFVAPRARVAPYTLLARTGDADVFHIQWPEGIFEGRAGRLLPLAALKAARVLRTCRRIHQRGGIVALTLHNLKPHADLSVGRRLLWSYFHGRLLRQTDLLVSLTDTALRTFRAFYPEANQIEACIVPHPHYRESYPASSGRAGARRALDLPPDARIIGVIGSLRASKQVPAAIAAFRAAAREGEVLLVAGGCAERDAAALREAIGGDERVRFVPASLSADALAQAFAAVDACLINQESTLNSGTAVLSLSLNRPVLAPDVGSLGELRRLVGHRWVSLFQPPLDARKLRRLLDGVEPAGGATVPLEQFAPKRASLRLLNALACRRAARPCGDPQKGETPRQ